MFRATRNPTSQPQRPLIRIQTICVVDPSGDDYRGWQQTADACGVRLLVVATADEALRAGRLEKIDLWVVNTDLAGLSGFELCGMLKARSSQTIVYLVADHYSPLAEQMAFRARATLFGCKGSHSDWLNHWLGTQPTASVAADFRKSETVTQ